MAVGDEPVFNKTITYFYFFSEETITYFLLNGVVALLLPDAFTYLCYIDVL